MIDHMLPRDLDDIYGPGAENADDGIDYDAVDIADGPTACDHCGSLMPASHLREGLCCDCDGDKQ